MRVQAVLFLLGIAIIHASKDSDESDELKELEEERNSININSSEQGRWRPILPKNHRKFVVTTKTIKASTDSTVRNRPSYKIKYKTIPKAIKISNRHYWKTSTTRRPVMKFTKFIISPLTKLQNVEHLTELNVNKEDEEREIEQKHNISLFSRIRDANKDDSDESVDSPVNGKRNEKMKRIESMKNPFRSVRKYREKERREEKTDNSSPSNESDSKENEDITPMKVMKYNSELSSAEKDKEEFIFLQPKNTNLNIKKEVTDIVDSDLTTTLAEPQENTREKRSNNIIEEENLGTTISGFKFTGKVSSLSSDLIFKNINT